MGVKESQCKRCWYVKISRWRGESIEIQEFTIGRLDTCLCLSLIDELVSDPRFKLRKKR